MLAVAMQGAGRRRAGASRWRSSSPAEFLRRGPWAGMRRGFTGDGLGAQGGQGHGPTGEEGGGELVSVLGVPLKIRDEVVGILYYANRFERPPSTVPSPRRRR